MNVLLLNLVASDITDGQLHTHSIEIDNVAKLETIKLPLHSKHIIIKISRKSNRNVIL